MKNRYEICEFGLSGAPVGQVKRENQQKKLAKYTFNATAVQEEDGKKMALNKQISIFH
jgi:hypothetical protein